MSHFSTVKTRFQNGFYLKKALNELKITFNEQHFTNSETKLPYINFVIPQSNNHDIQFAWNGQNYELVADLSYWKQPSTIESFIDKVAQSYAVEGIFGESQKMGFQTNKCETTLQGSQVLILERWNP
jgi:hypothetical protein